MMLYSCTLMTTVGVKGLRVNPPQYQLLCNHCTVVELWSWSGF